MTSVSIVIPTYNRGSQVSRAIGSALNQTHDDIEVIIVDDASTDDTIKIIRQYEDNDQVRLIEHEKNRGANAARNTGIRASNGDYISFLDSDDELYPTHVEQVIDTLDDESDSVAAILTAVEVLSDETNYRTGSVFPSISHPDSFITQGTAMGGFSALTVTAEDIARVGYLDEALPAYQDADILLRIMGECEVETIDTILVRKYTHEGQIGRNRFSVYAGRQKFIQKHQDRFTREALAGNYYKMSKESVKLRLFSEGFWYLLKCFRSSPMRMLHSVAMEVINRFSISSD